MTVAIQLRLDDADAVRREVTANLSRGRAFVPGVHPVAPLDAAVLRIECAANRATVDLDVRVVMVSTEPPMVGVGLEVAWSPAAQVSIDAMLAAPPPAAPEEAGESADPDEDESDDGDDAPTNEARRHARLEGDPRFHRIRKLTLVERARLARDGYLEDRVMLERMYGRSVWEDLLRNPQISTPEVARIAAKGTVPSILLETIVANVGWTRQTVVRNALLRNPKLAFDSATKLLRNMNKNELRLVAQSTIYPGAVRSQARKLLGP